MNTAVTIVDTISRTILELAAIGAGLKLLLTVAPRFQIAAPKTPQVRVKVIDEAQAPESARRRRAQAESGGDVTRRRVATLVIRGALVSTEVAPGLRGTRGTTLKDAESLADAAIAGRRRRERIEAATTARAAS